MEQRSSKIGPEVLDLNVAAIEGGASPLAHLRSLIPIMIFERKNIWAS
jgi:hypothetical protein